MHSPNLHRSEAIAIIGATSVFAPKPPSGRIALSNPRLGNRAAAMRPTLRQARGTTNHRKPRRHRRAQNSFWGKAKETLNAVSTHACRLPRSGQRARRRPRRLANRRLGLPATQRATLSMQANKCTPVQSLSRHSATLMTNSTNVALKEAIRKTTGAVVDKLDQVTGKRLVELLEQNWGFRCTTTCWPRGWPKQVNESPNWKPA